jgi:two-component system cell cycle response regulator CtrA
MRILLVEDDASIVLAVSHALRKEGFNLTITGDGDEAMAYAKLYEFDSILLDSSLPPGVSYLDVIRQLRTEKVKTSIIVLSDAGNQFETMLAAFKAGADDCLPKPYHVAELIARTRAVVRRSQGFAVDVIHTGDLAVDISNQRVTLRGETVRLTGREYQMLELLSLRKGRTITKEQFMLHMYNGRDEPELKIIDVFICKLRKKLAAANKGDPIVETVWGRGYLLRDPKVESPSIVPSKNPSRAVA